MDSITPLKTPLDVTPEVVERLFAQMSESGVAFLAIEEAPAPRPPHSLDVPTKPSTARVRRVVLAAIPDSEEIMVAMEGNGCIFLDRSSQINPFVFVTAGFQMRPAQIMTKLFVDLAQARAGLEAHTERAYPQLTHQNRS